MIPFKVETSGDELLTLSKRAFNRVMKATYFAVGRYWDRHFVATHFKVTARRKYGYLPRSRKYEAKKKRLAKTWKVKKQGRVDLVFTGLTERIVSRPHAVRAFPTRATVSMAAPSYIMSRTRKRRALKQELLLVSDQEYQKLEEVALAAQTAAFEEEMRPKRGRRRRR